MAMKTDTKTIFCELDDTGRHPAALVATIEVKPDLQPDTIASMKVIGIGEEKHTAQADVFCTGHF